MARHQARRAGSRSSPSRSLPDEAGMVAQEAGSVALRRLREAGHDAAIAAAQADPASFYRSVVRVLLRAAMLQAGTGEHLDNVPPEACEAESGLDATGRVRDLQPLGRRLLHVESGCDACAASHLALVYQALLRLDPTVNPDRCELALQPAAQQLRWQSGSYFTPRDVVERLLDLVLNPVLDRACEKGEKGVLEIRICDPACGAGAFLVPAALRIASRLEQPGSHAAAPARARVLEQVLASCVVGVDLDPTAAELCRFALWMQAGLPPSPLPWRFLEHRIRVGNSLLGATPGMLGEAPIPPHRCKGAGPRAACDSACMALMNPAKRPYGEPFFHWHLEFPDVFCAERGPPHPDAGWSGGFDVVVGNPPFLNQLETATALSRQVAGLLRRRFDNRVRCYADSATAFLALGAELLRPGGRLTMIQPQSMLATRDARPTRSQLLLHNTLEAFWIPRKNIFDASVRVCAPVLSRGSAEPMRVQLFDDGFAHCGDSCWDANTLAQQETWSPLVARVFGVPSVRLQTARVLGDVATVTADFRDQFYGLRGAVVDDAASDDAGDAPPLVTTGVIDLAHCRWCAHPVRFDGRIWTRPRVDLWRLDGRLQRWARQRLRPKIIVATQTRIIECVVDAEGKLLPTTPLISILPRDPAALWQLAAALCSPPVTALALERHAGAGLSGNALKLSARQVAALPLPPASPLWDEAGECFRQASSAGDADSRMAHLLRCARTMCEAYELTSESSCRLIEWWRGRLGGRKGTAHRLQQAPSKPRQPAAQGS